MQRTGVECALSWRPEGAPPPRQPMAIDAFGGAPRAVIADVAAAQPPVEAPREACFVKEGAPKHGYSVKLFPSTSFLGPAGGDGERLAFKRVSLAGLAPDKRDEALRMVRREMRLLSRLAHPNVVRLLFVVTDQPESVGTPASSQGPPSGHA